MQNHNYGWTKLVRCLCAVGLLVCAVPAPGRGGPSPDDGMQAILDHYLKIQEKLAADSVDGVAAEAQHIARRAHELDPSGLSGEHAVHLRELPPKIEGAAKSLSATSDIDAARVAFKDLSQPMVAWATMARPPGVRVVYCEMAKASWLQRDGAIRNPYYGGQMLSCGHVVSGAGGEAGSVEHDGHSPGHGSHGGDHEHRHGEVEQCGPHGDGC